MSARLYAYGGTGYERRNAVGGWPDAWHKRVKALLDDPIPPAFPMSFGVSLADSLPVLVIRVTQRAGQNRTYPLTLFVDPGESVWKRVGWNGARLFVALQLNAPEQLRVLCESPQTVTVERLEALFTTALGSGLENESGSPPLVGVTPFLEEWIGASTFDREVTISIVESAVSPDRFLRDLVTTLEILPPCFRSGLGWLFNGTIEQANAIAARLLIAIEANDATSDNVACRRRGEQLHAGLRKILAMPIQKTVDRLLRTPMWHWESDLNTSPAQVFEMLGLRGETVAAQVPALQNEPKVESARVEPPVPPSRVASAASATLPGVLDAFSAAPTPELCERGGPAELGNALAVRAYEKRVAEDPTDALPRLWLEVSSEAGSGASEIRDVIRSGIIERAREDVMGGAPLDAWDPSRYDGLDTDLASVLQDAAVDRVRTGRPGSVAEYLRYGNDDGGRRLSSPSLGQERTESIVDAVLKEVEMAGTQRAVAVRWLTSLASSQIREILAIDTKLRVAIAVRGPWEPLLAIGDLVAGRPGPPLAPLGPDEQARLLEELEALAATVQADTLPNIEGLSSLFGDHATEALQLLSRTVERVSWSTLDDWAGACRSVGRTDLLDEAIICLLRHASPAPIGTDLLTCADGRLISLFQETFFDPIRPPNFGPDRVQVMLDRCSRDDRIRVILGVAILTGLGEIRTTRRNAEARRSVLSDRIPLGAPARPIGLLDRAVAEGAAALLAEVYTGRHRLPEFTDDRPTMSRRAAGRFALTLLAFSRGRAWAAAWAPAFLLRADEGQSDLSVGVVASVRARLARALKWRSGRGG